MGHTYYTVAIELSSSKISGAVSVETTEGMMILAAASVPVDGFISKGIVRNVDKTSGAISSIIDRLEENLDNISIKKAYVTFAGLSVHSIKSKVSRGFGEYIKITQEIIDEMESENRDTFQTPEGYKRLQVDTQEYKFEGNVDYNPIGAPTQFIECNYLNLVMKEQYYKQLCDSFAGARIEIVDCFSAALIEAETLLSSDLRRNGCALVNIGAETTTIQIYDNDRPKMLTVLPLGSNNITRDLTAERISFDQAEEIKITRGYKSPGNESAGIDSETANNIINARMSEILQNVRYQIEESGERVRHIVFTGGGSKLKNLKLLLEEFLPNFTTEIKPEAELNLLCEDGVNIGVITTSLHGLLKQGRDNCCEKLTNTPVQNMQNNADLFSQDEEDKPSHNNEEQKLLDEERRREEEEKARKKKEEEEAKKRSKEESRKKREKIKNSSRNLFGSLFEATKTWLDNATKDEDGFDDEEYESEEENENNDNPNKTNGQK